MYKLILIDQMIKNLLNLFFPKLCYACIDLLSDNEKHLCTSCRHSLPVTNAHFENENLVEKVFYGRVKIENATALLKFQKKGRVQHLLHNLKYKGQEKIGDVLGRWLGHELKESKAFESIDLVIPVPIHKKKLRKRGYNQVTKFGQAIAQALNTSFSEQILLKSTATSTQVFKKRLARWNNNEEIFTLQKDTSLSGKHILLVDDIITTGATVEACANILQKHGDVKISVATMAIAE